VTSFDRRRHVVPAGSSLALDADWREVYAVVAQGAVELRTPHGGRLRLETGDVLCLARIGPATVVALGPDPAVLTTVTRPTTTTIEGAPDMQMKLELVPVPVTDVDRSAAFYEKVGFVRDVDVTPAEGVRVLQLTPPGSACSILLSTGLPEMSSMTPGTVKGLHLVVEDIAAARQELLGRGVEVGDLVPVGGGVTYAGLTDPDGNTLTLQQMDWRTGDAY
jgi:predicted enzyme related to lactoylglutathione lyase